MLKEFWRGVSAIFVFIATALAAFLPKRYWSRLGDLAPDSRAVFASAVLTMAFAGVIGFPGFFRYAAGSSDLAANMSLEAAAWPTKGVTRPHPRFSQGVAQGAWGASMLSCFAFVLLTPLGQLSGYLALTGLIRAVETGVSDQTRGEPLLTLVDSAALRGWRARNARRARRLRERLEGPEVADLLVSGRAAGIEAADYVVIASRRKAGWEHGVFVLTPGKWFKLGAPVERDMPGGLRTLYPLTELRTQEVLRRGVPYELPPLTGR